jgi:phenylalanyl-tRNA synthetase beta chain
VAIGVQRLNELLGGGARTMDELAEALGNLGCDVEDTAELIQYGCPVCKHLSERLPHEAAPRRCDQCEAEQPLPLPAVGRRSVIRLDLLADRPDLFDVGGLSRALKGLFGLERGLPRYPVAAGQIVVTVDPALEGLGSYWPLIAAAELEVAPLDQDGLRELMRLQESLHWGIARDRKLCAIGVYDLDSLTPPIRFTRIEPEGLRFVPLAHGGQPLSARQILAEHPKGRAYAHLLAKFEAYPLLIDAADQVLSMPPIINSEETRLKVGTRRLFAEVTGVTSASVRAALHTLVGSMAELGAQIRSVEVRRPTGAVERWPDLEPKSLRIDLDEARAWLGLDLDDPELLRLLEKMRLEPQGKGPAVQVLYPSYRTDVRHPVDLFADLAIGHGYGSMPTRMIPTMTSSAERPEERLSNRVRGVMIGLRFWEVMSLVQTTPEKHFRQLRREPDANHVVIANPKNVEVTMVRSHLMTGLLETLQRNRRKATPQQFFEIGNVVLLDPEAETGTREERRLAFVIAGPDAGYAAVRGVTDGLCHELGVRPAYRPEIGASFVPGRCAGLSAAGSDGASLSGVLGELHPEVLENFSLSHPVALAELSLGRVL